MEPGLQIKVQSSGETFNITAPEGSMLTEALRPAGVNIPAECAGRGTCGTCRVRFLEGAPEETEFDKKIFTEDELGQGWRLACKARFLEHVTIEVPVQKNIQILHNGAGSGKSGGQISKPGFAVDIGTTTVAVYLIDVESGEIVGSLGELNEQRRFGADVSSRIHYATEHGTELLQSAIVKQLNGMIAELCSNHSLNAGGSFDILAVGNTAMAHFLLGYDVSSLGVAPYKPHSLERVKMDCGQLGFDIKGVLTMMEGISGYVGSDVLAGAALCGLMESEKYRLLIDIGTNGEIMLGNRRKLLCCSAAAGPAFEGVNIHCGMGASAGAVSKAEINDRGDKFIIEYETIGGEPPAGICGSGVVDIVAEFLEKGVIDATGRFSDYESVHHGLVLQDDNLGSHILIARSAGKDIVFTQKDVREVQLAKGAIAAGIGILIDEAGISFDDIETVYLAGGFGNFMNVDNAITVGLIPWDLADKVEQSGNTAGAGAIKALCSEDFKNILADYAARARHIELSEHRSFQHYFVREMRF